jgi:transposase-like protein
MMFLKTTDSPKGNDGEIVTRKKHSAKKVSRKEQIRELLRQDTDLLKALVQEVVQQVLEAERDEVLGAEKGERTPNRLGYRAGYYGRSLVARVGKMELRVPQDRQGRCAVRRCGRPSG